MILKIFIVFIFLTFNIHVLVSVNIKGVVSSDGDKLENAVVYIEKIEGKVFTPPDKPAELDQIDLTFIPHILPILIGSTVVFPNNDVTRHNVFSPNNQKKIDLGTYSPGTSKSVVFDKAGIFPMLCHVHPEMSAFIIVLETPYFAVTSETGDYIIKDVPPGRYKLVAWHETTQKDIKQIDVSSNQNLTINFDLEE